MILRFLLHLVVAFLAGAMAVGIASAVTTLATSGRVALLEVRGLPIFIAGAVSIVIFALLQTSGRERSRPWMAGRTLVGFVLLVAGVVLAFQPSIMANMQSRLDTAIGVFGEEDTRAVEGFQSSLDEWSGEVQRYQSEVLGGFSQRLATIGSDEEVDDAEELVAQVEDRLRRESGETEQNLTGILSNMRAQGSAAGFGPLRQGLLDLSDIYADQLEGIRLVSRGFVERDQESIRQGDDLYKDAVQRAVSYFDTQLDDLLARGPVDSESFRESVARLAS